MKTFILIIIISFLIFTNVQAYRVATPRKFTDITDPTQITELNEILRDLWDITNGRYVNLHGEIYTSDNTTETTIVTQNVWVQVTVFDTNGKSNGTTSDHTEDHIKILTSGKYLVIVSASVLSGAGSAFDGEFEVKKNNGATDLLNVHTDRDLAGGGGDHGSISMSGIVDFSVNDTVEVWTRNKTNTTNLTFEDITLSVVQIAP